jgi:RNA polymerase sigma-70 factor, ECF subfamily
MSATSPEPQGLESLSVHFGISAEKLLPELYQNLRRMAHRQLIGERAGHSLDTTALVHEAWLKLVASYPEIQFSDERDFLALSGHLMRRVLTDHARRLHRIKRGGDQIQMTYTDGLAAATTDVDVDELIALDLALSRLDAIDARQVQVVELRYFAGFSIEETAELMSLSVATVKREWAMARAWLLNSLREAG